MAQTKEALAMQAGKARTAAAFTHGYGENSHSTLVFN